METLILCFLFVFSFLSILGMHLFGCKFGSERDGDTLPDRKNFDSLLWAIVTVFQVSRSLLNIHISPSYGQFSCSFLPKFTLSWQSTNSAARWPRGLHLPSGRLHFLCDDNCTYLSALQGTNIKSSKNWCWLKLSAIQRLKRQFPPE